MLVVESEEVVYCMVEDVNFVIIRCPVQIFDQNLFHSVQYPQTTAFHRYQDVNTEILGIDLKEL